MLTRTASTRLGRGRHRRADLIGHAFDKKEAGVLDELDHIFGNRPVIHRVFNLVGPGGGTRVDIERQANHHVLLMLALIVVDPQMIVRRNRPLSADLVSHRLGNSNKRTTPGFGKATCGANRCILDPSASSISPTP